MHHGSWALSCACAVLYVYMCVFILICCFAYHVLSVCMSVCKASIFVFFLSADPFPSRAPRRPVARQPPAYRAPIRDQHLALPANHFAFHHALLRLLLVQSPRVQPAAVLRVQNRAVHLWQAGAVLRQPGVRRVRLWPRPKHIKSSTRVCSLHMIADVL